MKKVIISLICLFTLAAGAFAQNTQLSHGCKGAEVKKMKKLISSIVGIEAAKELDEKDYYGDITEATVNILQFEAGFEATGIFGEQELKFLASKDPLITSYHKALKVMNKNNYLPYEELSFVHPELYFDNEPLELQAYFIDKELNALSYLLYLPDEDINVSIFINKISEYKYIFSYDAVSSDEEEIGYYYNDFEVLYKVENGQLIVVDGSPLNDFRIAMEDILFTYDYNKIMELHNERN